jgi:hypothetical protein
MLPAMVHRTLSARDVSYLKEGPLAIEIQPIGHVLAFVCSYHVL